MPLFVLDPGILERDPVAPNRLRFLTELNWQWAAGTGTRPNRILNPIRQAERFDPDGAYTRHWLPELANLPGASIHKPWRTTAPAYPAPLVEFNGM
ncbi:FAD-binding domain-containing protein [Nocardia sp. CDC153]|uniref:FAD-binding domain-containing protein n=1 Tax=Nocardia sp. CDC153 TaxID=3112167 RepID=UPI002DBEEA86|nr:FAD-binding domain-containing protein [Nocardia sp. CDC153]MEC3953301.1 FAD-binding domain-containing protein [Nocardia sp. CDC153]